MCVCLEKSLSIEKLNNTRYFYMLNCIATINPKGGTSLPETTFTETSITFD